MPPVLALRARGVVIHAGSDNIRDLWNPLGTGDMLERAFLLAYRSGFRHDPDLEIAGDLDWLARIQDLKISTFTLPDTLYFKRLHSGNLSHNALALQVWRRELATACRASILRKTRGQGRRPVD